MTDKGARGMTDKKEGPLGVNVEIDFWLVCLTVLLVLFWGEPDIHDAIIHALSDGKLEPQP